MPNQEGVGLMSKVRFAAYSRDPMIRLAPSQPGVY